MSCIISLCLTITKYNIFHLYAKKTHFLHQKTNNKYKLPQIQIKVSDKRACAQVDSIDLVSLCLFFIVYFHFILNLPIQMCMQIYLTLIYIKFDTFMCLSYKLN